MTSKPLTKSTRVLHWLVALMMINLLVAGVVMNEFEIWFMYPIHKSLGILALLIIIPRVVMRLVQGWPEHVSQYKPWEVTLSKVVHWVLLLATLAMPISGMLMSWAGGHGLAIFGLELIAGNPDLANPSKMIPLNEALAGRANGIHEIIGKVLLAAVILHIAGALKHHIVDKDRTLLRMLGR